MSDGLRVDFSDVQAAKFDPVPAGWYNVKITDVEVREGKESGAQYLNIEFTVQEGDYARRKFWNNINFGEKSLPYTLAFLQATERYPDGVGNTTLPEIIDTITGADLQVKVTVDRENDTNPVKRARSINDEVVGATQSMLP